METGWQRFALWRRSNPLAKLIVAKALCRACPRRWDCAREACELPGVQGIWAGVFVPESGRTRTTALRQMQSLADHGARQASQ